MVKNKQKHQKSDKQVEKINPQTWAKFIKMAAPSRKVFLKLFSSLILLAILENISPLLIRFSINYFIKYEVTDGLFTFALAYLLIIIAISLGILFYIKASGRFETDLSYNIRQKGFAHLQDLSFSYYDRTPVGWILSRMINDVTRLCEVVSFSLIDLTWGGMTIIVILAAMLYMNFKLALIALLAIPLVIILTHYFQKVLITLQRKIRQINSEITGEFTEGITGAKTSKTLLREEANEQEFFKTVAEMRKESIKASRTSAYFLPIVSLIGTVVAALILTIGGRQYRQGLLEIGTLYALFSYALRLWDPIRQVANVFREVQAAQAAAERVIGLLNEEVEITDKAEVITQYGLADGQGKEAWPKIKGQIEFKNVSFAYKPGEPVIDQLNLLIKAGESLAIVGETGAGKTSLVNLAARFYEPQSGQILIDGLDITNLPQAWLYQNLGYVLQTPYLFSGSIADNIRYGRLDASMEEVIQAAKLVHADRFIEKLDNSYDTLTGQAGSRLSTGEKQLISLARAVIADPAILILDEASSSIDTETEKEVQEAMDLVLKGRTSLIIAHRLSTIKNADHIIVLDKGKIIEEGRHTDLMARKGRYFKLYTGQFTISQDL